MVFPQIPGYRFQKRLGEGGMAAVYLATQESLDRPVAIKVMELEGLQDEVSKQRFENEARTIAQLTHPCIVNIYEVGRTSDGRMYYIMPFLANGDLSQRDLRQHEDRIIRVLRALLSALDYAHTRGIVHRDVKSANVLYDVADRPLLTDFGIALSKRDTSRITLAGLAVGSSGYMAPEQARGDVVDGRADLYSVGVLAYELLTGRLPYQAPDALALALMHAQNPIPRLPANKRHWQFFIDKAMAKAPNQRYRDARQMLDATSRIERRTNQRLSGRFLRGYDKTTDGRFWKHPGTIALTFVLLVACGLYAVRDRLPWPMPDAGSGGQQAAPAFATDAAAATIALHAASSEPHPSPAAAAPAASPGALPAPAATPDAKATQPPSPAVASTPPASASPPSPTALSPDAAVFAEARDAIAQGNITSPADDNAVDLARMAWKLSPNANDTRTLAADALKALAEQQGEAIVQHHDPRVLDYQLKARQLEDDTIGRDAPVARITHATLAAALGRRVAAESSISDSAALKRTESLAKRIDLADVYAHALASAQQKSSVDATAVAATAAALGPGFVLLPSASPKTPPAAMARTEVTRHEYAEFVNSTRRPASVCKGSNPAPTDGRKTWSEPGFAVTSEQPVVCVSWNDANAYAAWLGAQKGQHYRLASSTDWQATSVKGDGGIAGKHAEWLQNCAAGCQDHLVSAHGADAAGRDATQGFDDVGFRVVRVLDARH
jgi:serine/threonine-protein kinase PpkA